MENSKKISDYVRIDEYTAAFRIFIKDCLKLDLVEVDKNA